MSILQHRLAERVDHIKIDFEVVMKRLMVACVALLLVVPAGAQPPMPMPMNEPADYFPLQKGNTWNYKAGSLTVVVKAADEEKIGETMCMRLETSLNGMLLNHEHVAVVKDKDGKEIGVRRYATGGQAIDPPMWILKLPPKKGEEWSVDATSKGEKIVGKFVTGEEEVPVTYEKDAKNAKNKKVKAVTVLGRDLLVNGQRVTLTSYYAPGVGMIKQVGSIAGVTKTLELTSFVPGKETP
jgi:hypothetical protein